MYTYMKNMFLMFSSYYALNSPEKIIKNLHSLNTRSIHAWSIFLKLIKIRISFLI